MNLPNRLTLVRVCLIPIYVVFQLLYPNLYWAKYVAMAVFIIASLTDMLDGKIARKYNLVTNFGKFMDPLADKLLVCSALICLVYLNMIPVWAVLIIVAREFVISGFRLVAAEKGLVLAASKTAKVKTAVQMVMVVSLMWDIAVPFHRILSLVLIIASVVLTVVSLAEYLVKNWSVMDGEM